MSIKGGIFAVLSLCLALPNLAQAEGREKASSAVPGKPAATAPAPNPAKLCDKKKPSEPGADAGTLTMTGVITKGAKPIKEPISWTVTRISGECRGQEVATKTGSSLKLKLDPGNYRVRALYDSAEASTQVTIPKKKEVKQQIDFRAATVTFRLIPHAGAPVIKQPINWQVFQYVKGNGGRGKQIAEGTAPHQRFLLTEGAYVVRANYVDTVTDLVVPVKAGDAFNYTVNLYSGKVALKAVDKKKNAVKGKIVYEIARAKPNGKGEVLATKVSPKEPLVLREGKYIVTAKAGDRVGKTEVEVKAGKTKNVVVTIP
jgi:hypothetical protein